MAEHTGGVSYKTGIVSDSRPGFARVRFPDLDGLVSDWLPLVVRKSLKDRDCLTLDEGEHVACVMDEYFEAGCILGAIYSEADTPPVASPDKVHFSFFDGGSFEYDRATGTLTIIATGPVNVTAGGPVTVTAPSVTIDSPQTTCTGALTVAGLLTYQGGMAGSGGGGAAATITGNVQVQGDVSASGTVMDGGGNSNHHSHP